jgi:hypothetical protein
MSTSSMAKRCAVSSATWIMPTPGYTPTSRGRHDLTRSLRSAVLPFRTKP